MNLKETLTENLGLKVLSLLLAVVLWTFVTLTMEGEGGATVPVRVKNLSPQLCIENRTPAVDLRIAGPRLLLLRLAREELAVTLDMQGVGKGTVAFHHLERTVQLPGGLRITRIFPAALELKVVERDGGDRCD